MKDLLESEGLDCQFFSDRETDFEARSIKLVSMHSIKGLEFPVVFIVGLDRGVLPYYASRDPESRAEQELKERRLLYVKGIKRKEEPF